MNAPISPKTKKIIREGNGRELLKQVITKGNDGKNNYTIKVGGKGYSVKKLGV